MRLLTAILLPLFVAVALGAPLETELKPPAVVPAEPVVPDNVPVEQANLVKTESVVDVVNPEVEPVVPVSEQKSEVADAVEEIAIIVPVEKGRLSKLVFLGLKMHALQSCTLYR